MSQQPELLQTQAISKTFLGVRALSQVDFTLKRGEVHALMGENGAGKSTLIKILSGVEQADAGVIYLEGQPIVLRSAHHGQDLGISTVYQEINLCGNLSVAENIFIGRAPRKYGRIDWQTIVRRAQASLQRLDIDIDVQQPLASFSIAIQQMVSIARALDISTKVLILDEPTSCLDTNEVNKLFQVMRQLKEQGMGIIFITHFLDQVYTIADRISVLRSGELVGSYETAALSRLELVSKMLGKEQAALAQLQERKSESIDSDRNEAVLQAHGIARQGAIETLDLELYAGQVVGLVGLLGSGRTETVRLLFGLDQVDSGSIRIDGQELTPLTPVKALRNGIGLCPEDRRSNGIIPDLSVRENIILTLQAQRGWFRSLSAKEQAALADRYIRALNIKTSDANQPIKNLSGGNQQKVILARWLATDPRILLLDEPTRGIDIGAKTEIQKLVLHLAEEGKAILFISSEIDEVLRCSHEIVVLRDRRKVATLSGEALQEAQIMRAIAERPDDDALNA